MGTSSSLDSDGLAKVLASFQYYCKLVCVSTPVQVHVLTHPRLVHASEITVQQPTVLEHAQPVLTPTERLRRSDDVILQALLTKQTILAQFLPGEKVTTWLLSNHTGCGKSNVHPIQIHAVPKKGLRAANFNTTEM